MMHVKYYVNKASVIYYGVGADSTIWFKEQTVCYS